MTVFDHPLHFSKTLHENKTFLLVSLTVASIFFLIASLAWPVSDGSAIGLYLDYYYDRDHSLRTIASSLIIGRVLEMSYTQIHVFVFIMYLCYLLCSYYIARLFGIVFARTALLLLILHFQTTVFFHGVGGDQLSCLATAIWGALAVRLYKNDRLSTQIFMGLTTFGLELIRPGSVVFVLFALHPIICRSWSWKNLGLSLAFFLSFSYGYIAYSAYNYLNFGYFSMIRSHIQGNTNVQFPGMALFMVYPMFDRNDGPASEKLFKLVESEFFIKKKDCYYCLQKDMTIEKFFTSRHELNWIDLIGLDESYSPGLIRQAALETIFKHPLEYFIRIIVFQSFHLSNRTLEVELPLPGEIPVKTTVEKNKSAGNADLMFQFLGKQRGNYYLAFIFMSSLFKILPPITYFMLASLLVFSYKEGEYKLLAAILIPTYAIFFLNAQYALASRFRMPFDFIFIIGGMAGILGNRTFIKWFFFQNHIQPLSREKMISRQENRE